MAGVLTTYSQRSEIDSVRRPDTKAHHLKTRSLFTQRAAIGWGARLRFRIGRLMEPMKSPPTISVGFFATSGLAVRITDLLRMAGPLIVHAASALRVDALAHTGRPMFIDRTSSCSIALLLVLSAGLATRAHADLISDWNAKAEAIAMEKKLLPPPSARGMAILHVAMFEAVNAVDRKYAPYKITLSAPSTVSKETAAAAAAHAVLLALHPEHQASLDVFLKTSLASIAEGEAKVNGIALGKEAAAGILALRGGDGMAAMENYRPHTSPGIYVPTTIPFGSTFGSVTPWVMSSGSQLRPDPPPPLSSQAWINDLNEIRELGGRDSKKRTVEQTDIGRFWLLIGPSAWNPIVRQLVTAKQLDLIDSARVFALVAMATCDAFIAVFDAKYFYHFWRPITAVRYADSTGNKDAPRESSWLPLGETPLHPEYPCAHCITSAAVASVLIGVLGNEIPEVSMTSPTAPGVTRKWTRLEDYANEVGLARIYAGLHYGFSNKVGQDMGRKIGALTVATQMRASASTPARR
jgi:hypothetical protein